MPWWNALRAVGHLAALVGAGFAVGFAFGYFVSWSWLTSATAPAWVQAVGSILAILVAVFVPWWQRRVMMTDSALAKLLDEKAQLRRLTSALSVEITSALGASSRQESAIRKVLQVLADARATGSPIKEPAPMRPGSVIVTSAVIYRQLAA